MSIDITKFLLFVLVCSGESITVWLFLCYLKVTFINGYKI